MVGDDTKPTPVELFPLFQSVGEVLQQNRESLNQIDPYNGDHGDHMVQIFHLATQAAREKSDRPVAEAMDHAAGLLELQAENGSAQVYAYGLRCMAEQLRKYEITLEDLVAYVRSALVEDREAAQAEGEKGASGKSARVLKALVSGLAAWGQVTDGQAQTGDPLDMGSLFEFGMAYVQAKQRSQGRVEVLADAAASVSPLSKQPHRYQSGKIAIQALLQAMQGSCSDLAEQLANHL